MSDQHRSFAFALRCAASVLLAGVAGCVPQAIFFHESTKVGFSATYNVSDSQPVSSHFGFKRRIAAVVPGQERVAAASGKEADATNQGDALSLVSKFYVNVGSREKGIEIRNNFATGNAARALTVRGNAKAIGALMQSHVVVGDAEVPPPASSATRTTPKPTPPPRKPTPVTTPSPSGGASPAATAPPLPDTPEMPAPSSRGTPTPPPATVEVGPDGSMKSITPKPNR